jgi:putative ABC transport system permease protein
VIFPARSVDTLVCDELLTFVLNTDDPTIVLGVIVIMMTASARIALRPLCTRNAQFVLQLPRWFEPRFVVPIGGLIFANAMNTISLAAERYESELERDTDYVSTRTAAMEAALIPKINALLAVGIVSLPGMMTGQILSGVDPLIAGATRSW